MNEPVHPFVARLAAGPFVASDTLLRLPELVSALAQAHGHPAAHLMLEVLAALQLDDSVLLFVDQEGHGAFVPSADAAAWPLPRQPAGRRVISRGLDGEPVRRPEPAPSRPGRVEALALLAATWRAYPGATAEAVLNRWALLKSAAATCFGWQEAKTGQVVAVRSLHLVTDPTPQANDDACAPSEPALYPNAPGALVRLPRSQWKGRQGRWTEELFLEVERLQSKAGGAHSMARIAADLGVARTTFEEAMKRRSTRRDKASLAQRKAG